MNFFRSKLNQVKHFTPFHDMILALNNVIKAEESIIKGQSKAFGEELRRYANSQKEDFVAALIAVADAGQQQVKLQQEVNSQFTTLPRDLQPLLQQETEMHKWREIVFKAVETAEKSRKEVEKAEAALNTSKARGNPADIAKKEAILASCQRKADDDTKSANDQKASLDEKEQPYREKFLDTFVSTLVASMNLRYKAAEQMFALADNFQEAAEKMHDFHDPSIDKYVEVHRELEKVVIE